MLWFNAGLFSVQLLTMVQFNLQDSFQLSGLSVHLHFWLKADLTAEG